MKTFRTILSLLAIMACAAASAAIPEYSTAGFHVVEGTGRTVSSMNPAWRYLKGDAAGAESKEFVDTAWQVVSLPHGIEVLPAEASGCVNYQGPVWYRKHFTPADSLQGKKLFLHFEGIMGKSRVWVNGREVAAHYGGYLPVIADITDALQWGADNVVAVWADNSDDPTYPPGKPQDMLDFAYFGGAYRDCWLVAHDPVHITDPNYENVTAGGGLAVWYDGVSRDRANVNLKLHMRNESPRKFKGTVDFLLTDRSGNTVATASRKVSIPKGGTATATSVLRLVNPRLWSPRRPELHDLTVRLKDESGRTVDGYRRRIGVRSIEFRGADGFWLNGEPYPEPLIGANRHQDYAHAGNAVSNSAHRRDAVKLKEAGFNVIRNAHCPQDPAFMDACDELGLLIIDNTPGWQFWNDAPEFGRRVYEDIRNLVRRDRNHPSVWLWEPILNETWYPADFALNARRTVEAEYPWPGCYSASDSEARGHEHFPVWFGHPAAMFNAPEKVDSTRTYFTREWGDNVDDWSSHNSPSRVSRAWGEEPMRVQAVHYAKPAYAVTSYDVLMRQPRSHVGGCLWHSFDHQRGYHPDPFYGGVMDAFRQPKYSYYMFMAQRPELTDPDFPAGTGPMVKIAHEMTPFSGPDVTVYSNCPEVRLKFTANGETRVYRRDESAGGMPSPIIKFDGVYDFMTDKALTRARKRDDVYLVAEGVIDSRIVATDTVRPARRPERIIMWVDTVGGASLRADGSDFVTVIAAVADRDGNIKRLNNTVLHFDIEGEGELIGDPSVNDRKVEWGTAPVLVRSTLRPGKITVRASARLQGRHTPVSGELVLYSSAPGMPLVYSAAEAEALRRQNAKQAGADSSDANLRRTVEELRNELNALKLREVERQQTEFGE